MISIIIPAHKEKSNLIQLVTYLGDMDNSGSYEIIIAQSPDCCEDIAKIANGTSVRLVKCEKKGRACQMNEGAEHAKGEIVAFLHADVRPPKDFLGDIESALATGFDAGFFSYKFDKDNFWLGINAFFTAKDGLFTGGGDQCLFIRKSVFKKLGGFDAKQVLMEDFEFFKRMKKNKIPYTIIKNDLVVSARKYESNSYLRVNLSNLLLVILFKLGYPSQKLRFLHDKLLRTPYNG